MLLYCSFVQTYNVHSSFFVNLVPKIQNCLTYLFLFLILITVSSYQGFDIPGSLFVYLIIIPSNNLKKAHIRLIKLIEHYWKNCLAQNLRGGVAPHNPLGDAVPRPPCVHPWSLSLSHFCESNETSDVLKPIACTG